MDTTTHHTHNTEPVLASVEDIAAARRSLITTLPEAGIGLGSIRKHLHNDLLPAFNRSSQSPNYYGFVTGGATPAALLADHVVSETDQNVQVHLPHETIATEVEDRALSMLGSLLSLPDADWKHRTFTTGATASNVVGLAIGREYAIREYARISGVEDLPSVAQHGLHKAMKMAACDDVQVLTTVAHSSLRKAAAIVGLGRESVIDVSRVDEPHRFDVGALEQHLKRRRCASIVAVSCAEVNTGLFATYGDDLLRIRQLCDDHGAWLHVDAAFGLLARVLTETAEFTEIRDGVEHLEVADSIAGDAHKLLNVPYDCGIIFSRHLQLATNVFQNPNAAYLSGGDHSIPSPLNVGIENSRRFRALPVYANLAAYGREGYRDMLERQIRLTRSIARYMLESNDYELLPKSANGRSLGNEERLQSIYIIVLFRAKNEQLSAQLVKRVNATRRIYISGTQWNGKPAARFAVANWQVDVERDLALIKGVLEEAAHEFRIDGWAS